MSVRYITPVEITPSSIDAFVDVNVSVWVPAGATGVILHAENISTSFIFEMGIRKNGSTDNRINFMSTDTHMWFAVGVDENRILEIYIGSTASQNIYLVGYFDDEAVFFTNGVDKSLTVTGAWTDISIAADTGADTAIGAIVEVASSSIQNFGLRANGSTDNRIQQVAQHIGAIIGVDGNEVFEGQIASTAVDFFLLGYIKSTCTFNVNATDVSLSTTSAWANLSALPAKARGGFYEAYQPTTSDFGFRTDGTTEDIKHGRRHVWAMVGASPARIVEGWITSTDTDFFLVGYSSGGPVALGGTIAGNNSTAGSLSKQKCTDFGGYTTGATPSDWSKRYTQTNQQWTVQSDLSADGGKVLRHASTNSVEVDSMLSWDALGTPADIEIVSKMRASSTSGDQMQLMARASGTINVNDKAYGLSFSLGTRVILYKFNNGYTAIQTVNYTWSANTWYWIRWRLNGTSIRARWWPDGAVEPSTWQIDAVDSTVTGGGWAGVEAYARVGTREWDNFCAALDGDSVVIVKKEPLAGSITASSNVVGALRAGVKVAGVIVLTSQAAGNLKVLVALAGSVTASTPLSASLRIRGWLKGDSLSSVVLTGSLRASVRSSGSVIGQSLLIGDLRLPKKLQGMCSGVSVLSGVFAVKIRLNGTASASGQLAVRLTKGRGAAGLIVAWSSLVGAIKIRAIIHGTTAGTSHASGVLGTRRRLNGTAMGYSQLNGYLSSAVRLNGSWLAAEQIAGTLSSNIVLTGICVAAVHTDGTMRVICSVASNVVAVSAMNGFLRSLSSIQGLITTSALVEGALKGQSHLLGTTHGESLIEAIIRADFSLGGNTATESDVVGRLLAEVPIAGTGASFGLLAGDLRKRAGLGAALNGFSFASGVANVAAGLYGTAQGVSEVAGGMSFAWHLTGTVQALYQLNGFLFGRKFITGLLQALSGLTGDLLTAITGIDLWGEVVFIVELEGIAVFDEEVDSSSIPEVWLTGEVIFDNGVEAQVSREIGLEGSVRR